MKLMANELAGFDAERVERYRDEVLPRVLPGDWSITQDHANAAWFRSTDGLAVCAEVEVQVEPDGFWLHISLSRRDRVPSYHDLKRVKALFVGTKRKAVMVFPSDDEHYNLHPYCLHLYAPLDADPLPDFRHASGAL